MQPEDSPKEPRVAAIAGELHDVARRLVPRAFGELGKQEALPIPELRSITERNFPQAWQGDPANALTLLLKRAINLLDGKFGDPPRTPKDTRITMQEAALRLFNFDGSPTLPEVRPLDVDDVRFKDVRGQKYNVILSELVKNANLHKSESGVTRHVYDLRLQLAKIITGPSFLLTSIDTESATPVSRVLVVRSVLEDEFVARPEYEQAIRQLRDAGEKHLWLWGDAGTGKTRLARAANRDRVAENAVPVLAGGNEQTLQDQIADLIVRSGIDAAVVNSANRWALFLDQLNKGRLPQTLVFDDMPRGELLTMLTATRGSFIIFTSIGRPPPGYGGTSIEVLDMTANESQQMIRSRLPHIQDTDLNLLAITLASRPLAIEHSCSYLRDTGMPIADFCTAVNQQPTLTLDAAGDRYGRTLTRVYELTLEKLNDSFGSLRALDYLLFTWPNSMTVEMVSEMWANSLTLPGSESPDVLLSSQSTDFVSWAHMSRSPGVAHVKPTIFTYVDPVSIVSLRAAIRRLEDFGLVRSETGILSIHQLTRSILRSLRADREQVVYERIRATVYELIRIVDEWQLGEAVPVARALWAVQLLPALASVDDTALGFLDEIIDAEVNRLASLLALTFRSIRQIGFSMDNFIRSVIHLTGVIFIRATHAKYEQQSRSAVFDSFYGLYKVWIDYSVGRAAFDRSSDGKILPKSEPDPQLIGLAIRSRLQHDTEWELAHHLANTTQWEAQATALNSPINLINSAIAEPVSPRSQRYKTFGRSSVEAATIHYHASRWNDAIGALEHAYSCYLKVGADTECTRGAIDAARRLARVHLRAGRLNDSSYWLIQAQWIFHERSEVRLNGMQLRYRLRDLFLEAQVNQVLTQVELTNEIYSFEANDSDETMQKLQSFIKDRYRTGSGELSSQSRMEEAEQAVDLVVRIGQRRLLPEARMHAVRLHMLAGEPPRQKPLEDLAEWFRAENLSYQSDLLHLQMETFSAPFISAFANFDENEVRPLIESLPVEVREQTLLKFRYKIEYSQKFYEATRSMWDKHRNRYWYARGLCACFIVAREAGHPQRWINGLRSELESAAESIDRSDWIEKTYAFGQTNGGLWLFGY